MRSFLVGLVLLAICGSAFGQADGFVEKIGFGKTYRPYGWTPLLVNLTSKIGDPAEYQIQVRQEDLDRDRVIFRRDIVLNPTKQEQFWVYFMAQPRGFGDGTAAALDKLLDVRLCTRSGKPLVKLKIQDAIINLDPSNQTFGARRGAKLVLFITDGASSNSTPAVSDFPGTVGINEDIVPVLLTPFDLPENVIGYDAVDAIVWLDADAGKMTAGGSRRMTAMTEWVRAGGRLVVSQPAELFKLEEMAPLLPVEVKSPAGDWQIQLRDKVDLQPIRNLSAFRTNHQSFEADKLRRDQEARWALVEKNGPFKVAYAKLRDDAVGEQWIAWNKDMSEMSPWIARRPLGLGSVTWVAQDLGNRAITGRNASGWPYVWDTVLGQRNIDMRVPDESEGNLGFAEKARSDYYANSSVDVGAELLEGMEHTGRAGGLIFLAGVFFVGYWVVAGPVSYLVLAGKKRTELSWGIFAVSALVATLMTVGVVRLVLRGDAEVHHVSLVRMLPAGKLDDGTPVSRAIINSRLGLYIPRDGTQTVKLLENDQQAASYVTPFSIHPAHQANTTDFPAYLEYEVPVRDNPLTEAVQVGFPYRSTLKKLQAQWVGHLNGGIDVATGGGLGNYDENKPKLKPLGKDGTIHGRLVNRVGTDLAHVYFAFHFPATLQDAPTFDYVLYLPAWADGQSIDLRLEYNAAATLPIPNTSNSNVATPGGSNRRAIRGEVDNRIGNDWAGYWYSGLRPSGMSDRAADWRNEYVRAFPMLSLYDRVPPERNAPNTTSRVEVLRRAAREWDISELVAAGQLVILAQGGKPGITSDKSPLPFPMEVDGERVIGSGTTFYQFALPLDRSGLTPPWTKTDLDDPATKPAPKANETKVER